MVRVRPLSPSTFSFLLNLEELPLHLESTGPDSPAWRAGQIDGEAQISFDSTREWWVSDVWLTAWNGQVGSARRTKSINLHPMDQLYLMIIDSIESRYEAQIQETIDAEFADMGFGIAAE